MVIKFFLIVFPGTEGKGRARVGGRQEYEGGHCHPVRVPADAIGRAEGERAAIGSG
jgi:hypothetical protein